MNRVIRSTIKKVLNFTCKKINENIKGKVGNTLRNTMTSIRDGIYRKIIMTATDSEILH